ncbi:MAG TPA: Hsp20/alpha crystallin family protein [Candidatus Eremiobacteraceae bacterium]|nr:Hsp20/alpha crystallin family protein [Candidatus Eremiobacteraceae bacterium]
MIVRKGNGATLDAPETVFERFFGPEEFFTDVPSIRRSFNSLFDTMLRPSVSKDYTYSVPAIDLYRKDGTYMIECALPGLRKEDVNIEIEANVLTISGKYRHEEKEEDKRYHYRELRRGSFSRSVSFPDNIDPDKVKASFDKGMLKVEVQALTPAKTKKIEITA